MPRTPCTTRWCGGWSDASSSGTTPTAPPPCGTACLQRAKRGNVPYYVPLAALLRTSPSLSTAATRTFLAEVFKRLTPHGPMPWEPVLLRFLFQVILTVPKESRLTDVDRIATGLQAAIDATPSPTNPATSRLSKPKTTPLSPPRPLSPGQQRSMSQALKGPLREELIRRSRNARKEAVQPSEEKESQKTGDEGKLRGWQFYQGTRFISIPTGGRRRK